MNLTDRKAIKTWDAYIRALRRSTAVDMDESPHLKDERIEHLLNNPIEFFKYYFPLYATADFADFQEKIIHELIENKQLYAALEMARDHGKTSLIMMITLFLVLKNKKENILMVSHNYDNAELLLKPYKLELENNRRIINDFGIQKSLGSWEDGKFVTRDGSSFRALGKGQSPRGSKNEEARPTIIILDDGDEDEEIRNPKRLDNSWEWVSGALYGCFDIAGDKRFWVVNNRLGKDCLLHRAIKVADFHIKVNILKKATKKVEKENISIQLKALRKERKKLTDERDFRIYDEAIKYLVDGYIPSWQRYSMYECAYMICKMGSRISQKEYFNNPTSEGKVFKTEHFQYKKLNNLSKYKNFLITYLDPSFKNKKFSDTKSWGLLGLLNGEIHVIKVFCDRASIENMVEWGYILDRVVKDDGAACQHFMEEVFLQDLLYKDFAAAAVRKKYPLALKGDKRAKPDKDARISGISGYFERGSVWFNELEKDSHHQQRFEEQLLNFEPGVNTLKDGPDMLEGGIFKLFEMVYLNDDITVGVRGAQNKNKL